MHGGRRVTYSRATVDNRVHLQDQGAVQSPDGGVTSPHKVRAHTVWAVGILFLLDMHAAGNHGPVGVLW